jgi:uncharacterized cupin superfamily protein
VVDEASLEHSGAGLRPVTDGWFVVNLRDAAWETNDVLGAACFFEAGEAPFAQLGVNVRVLQPGRRRWLYHAESSQEDFLVVAGECVLLVEGQERPLAAWDFVHCPPGTAHAFVPTGDSPCVIVMAGARTAAPLGTGIVYPRDDLALHHGVGVEVETTSLAEAWDELGIPEWSDARPDGWAGLPWAET